MATVSKDYVEDFIEKLAQQPICVWCRHPWQPIYKSDLCSHCYNIRRQLPAVKREIETEGCTLEREIDYKIALRKSQLARTEGTLYGNLHKRAISALDLEHELTDLAKKFVNKRLFYGDATSIGWALPLNQRTYVFYLVSLLQREYLRHRRHRIAQLDAQTMSLAEIEAFENP